MEGGKSFCRAAEAKNVVGDNVPSTSSTHAG